MSMSLQRHCKLPIVIYRPCRPMLLHKSRMSLFTSCPKDLLVFQNICMEPSNHHLFLSAMFSPIDAEVIAQRPSTCPSSDKDCRHPWLKQLSSDLGRLAAFHCDYEWLLQCVSTPIAFVESSELAARLAAIDVRILCHKHYTKCSFATSRRWF